MDPDRIQLVRQSWSRVEESFDRMALLFYQRLFELDPDLRPLFALVEIESQAHKFTLMIREIVRLLEDPDGLVETLAASGRRHRGYGVRERDYQTVGEAFLWALKETLGSELDDETRGAWAEAYTRMASLMREAHRTEDPPGPHAPTG